MLMHIICKAYTLRYIQILNRSISSLRLMSQQWVILLYKSSSDQVQLICCGRLITLSKLLETALVRLGSSKPSSAPNSGFKISF